MLLPKEISKACFFKFSTYEENSRGRFTLGMTFGILQKISFSSVTGLYDFFLLSKYLRGLSVAAPPLTVLILVVPAVLEADSSLNLTSLSALISSVIYGDCIVSSSYPFLIASFTLG